MKVLFVINSSNNGGAIKMIVTLYREMKHIYPKSKIVFLKRIESQYSDIEDAYYLTDQLSTPFEYLSTCARLHSVISKERPDATISFLPLANILTSVIGKKLGVKVRIASQRNPPQTYGRVMRVIDKFVGSRGFYTANVCNSEAGMAAFRSYPTSYKALLSVIHNCVEPADLSLSVEEAKDKLGFPKDKVVLTCVARLHEQKNHQLLIKAMRHLNNAILCCAGDGPLKEQILSLINREGVQDKVILLGDLERQEVRTLLRASDIFVIPSKYEGLSNSLIEAMSYGLPIVFSNIPSFTTFLETSEPGKYAGVLVDSNDGKVWANELNRLMNDPILMDRLQQMSFNKVAVLSPKKMTDRFRELLDFERVQLVPLKEKK